MLFYQGRRRRNCCDRERDGAPLEPAALEGHCQRGGVRGRERRGRQGGRGETRRAAYRTT